VAWGDAKSPQIEKVIKMAANLVFSLALARFTGKKGFRIFR
jgi:hypothetical protein